MRPDDPLFKLAEAASTEARKVLRDGFSLNGPHFQAGYPALVSFNIWRMAGNMQVQMPVSFTLGDQQANTPEQFATLIQERVRKAQDSIADFESRTRTQIA